jgi:hypothetical protein
MEPFSPSSRQKSESLHSLKEKYKSYLMSLKKKSFDELSLIARELGVRGNTKSELIRAIQSARKGKSLDKNGQAAGSIGYRFKDFCPFKPLV